MRRLGAAEVKGYEGLMGRAVSSLGCKASVQTQLAITNTTHNRHKKKKKFEKRRGLRAREDEQR